MRIALFITCIGDTFFADAGRATVRVLERLGHEVVFPEEQTCCGQMHLNSGYRETRRGCARRFEQIFAEFDVVVSPSSSCVGTVRELYPELKGRSAPSTTHVFELSELLVHRLGVDGRRRALPAPRRVPPDLPLAARDPRRRRAARLLRNVRGLELVELPRRRPSAAASAARSRSRTPTRRARCSPTSARRSRRPAPRVCTAVDGSCLLQIGGGLCRARGRPHGLHLAEILARLE